MTLTAFSSGVNTSFSSQLNSNFQNLDHKYYAVEALSDVSIASSTTYTTLVGISLASSLQCNNFVAKLGFSWTHASSATAGVNIQSSIILDDNSVIDVLNQALSQSSSGPSAGWLNFSYGAPTSKYIKSIIVKGLRTGVNNGSQMIGTSGVIHTAGTDDYNLYMSGYFIYNRII
jgi:hypothetical protein